MLPRFPSFKATRLAPASTADWFERRAAPGAQEVTFVLFTHPEKSLLADGHGNVPPPEPAKPGQHWSPAHMLPEPGHCTSAPILQVPLELVVIVVVVIVVVVVVAVVVTTVPEEVQSVTFVLFTHPEKPLLADGHGNVPPPEPA